MGGDKYIKDKDFLKSCFIFTCLSRYNKCLSFIGSDKKFYKNELCFDEGTIASGQLQKYKLNKDEEKLVEIWISLLKEAKKTKEYIGKQKENVNNLNSKNIINYSDFNSKDLHFTYGPYQIEMELNTFIKDDKDKKVYNHPILNGHLDNLKKELKKYYASHITNKLFKYELLK